MILDSSPPHHGPHEADCAQVDRRQGEGPPAACGPHCLCCGPGASRATPPASCLPCGNRVRTLFARPTWAEAVRQWVRCLARTMPASLHSFLIPSVVVGGGRTLSEPVGASHATCPRADLGRGSTPRWGRERGSRLVAGLRFPSLGTALSGISTLFGVQLPRACLALPHACGLWFSCLRLLRVCGFSCQRFVGRPRASSSRPRPHASRRPPPAVSRSPIASGADLQGLTVVLQPEWA